MANMIQPLVAANDVAIYSGSVDCAYSETYDPADQSTSYAWGRIPTSGSFSPTTTTESKTLVTFWDNYIDRPLDGLTFQAVYLVIGGFASDPGMWHVGKVMLLSTGRSLLTGQKGTDGSSIFTYNWQSSQGRAYWAWESTVYGGGPHPFNRLGFPETGLEPVRILR